MFNLNAFYSSVAQNAVYSALAAVPDQTTPISTNGRFLYQQNMRVKKASVMGTALQAARLDSASLRQIALPEIYPTIVAAAVPTLPAVADWGDNGPLLSVNEEVAITVSHGGAGADDIFGVVHVAPRFVPAPAGQYLTLLAAGAAVTLAKGTWAVTPLVFNQVLPSGDYDIVGLAVVCPGAMAARLIFPDNNTFRPGVFIDAAYGNKQWNDDYRNGRSGLFGTFKNTVQPMLEVFGVAAGAQTPVVYIDIRKR